MIALSCLALAACATSADLGGAAEDGGATSAAVADGGLASDASPSTDCIVPTASNYSAHQFPYGTCASGGCAPGSYRLPASLNDYAVSCPAPSGGSSDYFCAASLCLNDGGACGALAAHPGLVEPGGTLAAKADGAAARFQLAYQGSRLAVLSVTGVSTTLGPSAGPFTAGQSSGYWFELRDASDKALDTRAVQDPTTQSNGGTNATLPACSEKLFEVVVKGDASARFAVLFGPPYGTALASTELARFRFP